MVGIKSSQNIEVDQLRSDWMDEKVSLGTTIMAVEFDGGIICGADSRTSAGQFVTCRFQEKITHLADNIMLLRSGSAADSQAVSDITKYYLSVHEMQTGEPALVSFAANTFRNLIYEYRDQLLVGAIIAGFDKRHGAQIYSTHPGGQLTKHQIITAGSGSTYILGYCDANFKEKMTKDECIQFVINAVSLAIHRDGSSGGSVRLAIMTKDDIEKKVINYDQLPKFSQL